MIRVKVQFSNIDKQSNYGHQNNYIRDFPSHDKQSWTILDSLIVSVTHIPNIDKQSDYGHQNNPIISKQAEGRGVDRLCPLLVFPK